MDGITPEPGRYPVTIEAQVNGDPGEVQELLWVVTIRIGDTGYQAGGKSLEEAAADARKLVADLMAIGAAQRRLREGGDSP